MRNVIKLIGCAVTVLSIASCATYMPVEIEEALFTRAEVEEDFEAFIEFVKTTHPDLEYSADLLDLEAAADAVRTSLRDDMTIRNAWMAMAVINPVFADAHIGLRRPINALAAYEESGGQLFPASVVFDAVGKMQISASTSASLGVSPGDEILSINGVDAREIYDKLMPRMRGESEVLGRLVMELYFSQYFWLAHGGYERYVVRVRNQNGIRNVELMPQDNTEPRNDINQYTYKKLGENVGYLNVTSFDIKQLETVEAFLADAFKSIKNDGIDKLIIDLRENTGGAHDVSDLLMAYLTSEPYSAISGVTARITDENINLIPGSELGDVVTIPFHQFVTPPVENALRFNGDVYAIVGGRTYSQAIVFASTLQDFEIATIVGEETEGPANQTGQVQATRLPNTGMQVLAPIYIFTRASGDSSRRGVIPEIEISNDPLEPMRTVEALLQKIAN